MTFPPQGQPTATVAILLAGGSSTRWPDGHKLLTEIDGASMLSRACCAVTLSSAKSALVVLGADADRLEPACRASAIHVVRNPDYRSGQSTSLHVGVRAAPTDATGFLISVADQPCLTHHHLDRLITAGERSQRIACVRDQDGRRRGAPAWFPAHLREQLLSLHGDRGAQSLIKAAAEITEVDLPTEALVDIDRPEDLDRLASHRCRAASETPLSGQWP